MNPCARSRVGHLGRSLESHAVPGNLERLPVEIRGDPWKPVESSLICLGSINNNIPVGITCDHPGGSAAPSAIESALGCSGLTAQLKIRPESNRCIISPYGRWLLPYPIRLPGVSPDN